MPNGCESAAAYFLSLATDPELSTRAMAGSDKFAADAKDGPLSAVPDSPSDVAPGRNFCGIMLGVWVRFKICCVGVC